MARLFARATHSDRLERWLGAEQTEWLSQAMRGWYGPPIAIAGVPGSVWACGDGDFRGPIACGQHSHALDFVEQRLKRIWRNVSRPRYGQLNTGFAGLSDLLSEAKVGKRSIFPFTKTSTFLDSGTVGDSNSLWKAGAWPVAAANAPAAPGGNAPTSATVGAFKFTNPSSPDTQHFLTWALSAGVARTNLLLYDRLFQVDKTPSSTATEAVTGVPTRYQSQTATDQDYIGGNFLFMECEATAAQVAHNWTVCTYTDQDGNASTLPSIAGRSGVSLNLNILDMPVRSWFAPLEGSDVGIKNLTQMQCSASNPGALDFVIGHPIAWMPSPLLTAVCAGEGLNSSFSLVRIFNDAAMALIDFNMPADGNVTHRGWFETVAG